MVKHLTSAWAVHRSSPQEPVKRGGRGADVALARAIHRAIHRRSPRSNTGQTSVKARSIKRWWEGGGGETWRSASAINRSSSSSWARRGCRNGRLHPPTTARRQRSRKRVVPLQRGRRQSRRAGTAGCMPKPAVNGSDPKLPVKPSCSKQSKSGGTASSVQ